MGNYRRERNSMKGKQPNKQSAGGVERLKAAGRLNEFRARRRQLDSQVTDSGDGDRAANKQSVGEEPSAAAGLNDRVAGLRALLKTLPTGKRVPDRDLYDWVGEHLESAATDLDPRRIPNRFAVSLLIAAIATPEGMERFLARHKALSKNESTAGLLKRFEDDGRNLDAFFARVQRVYDEEEAAEQANNASAGKSQK